MTTNDDHGSLGPAAPNRSAYRLVWVAPPGWDAAPVGFAPNLDWRPSRYWPEPPEDWEFWQVVGDDEAVELFHQPRTLPPRRPAPVWAAPDHWPQPPPGWHPPAGWTPDLGWMPSPAGWRFWHQPAADEHAIAAAKLTTPSDRLAQLNEVERLMRLQADLLAFFKTPIFQRRMTIGTKAELRRLKREIDSASSKASEVILTIRDRLVWSLRYNQPRDPVMVDCLARLYPLYDHAESWTRRIMGMALSESAQDLRLRLLNSRPFGAVDLDVLSPARYADGDWDFEIVVPEADWKRAEQLAALALRRFGYLDAQVTESGSDGGIDVRATGLLAQVKYTSRPVGRPVIQQLLGAADGLPVACFALSGYTQQALTFSADRGISLFTIELPHTVKPANLNARELATRRSPGALLP
ncbi:restriction endonuclease [Pimelobacter simplex]|uniref:restriction endonuclease n=1 Tax=Nocardioides simplex TaxID=2045 RepID=UPI003AAE38CB